MFRTIILNSSRNKVLFAMAKQILLAEISYMSSEIIVCVAYLFLSGCSNFT